MEVKIIGLTQYIDENREIGEPEELIERAARVCYRSDTRPGKRDAFLRARIRDGHTSILEHASVTFEISGISRACSHQIVRHRIASYSQESQRYVDMSDPEFSVPPSIAENDKAMQIWNKHMTSISDVYEKLRKLGVKKEDARFVLPNASQTKIVCTMNYRSLLNFFSLRLSPHAQWEIRRVAWRMLNLIAPLSPVVFGDALYHYVELYPDLLDMDV